MSWFLRFVDKFLDRVSSKPYKPGGDFGCRDFNFTLGPWEESGPGLSSRKGPPGYRTMFGDEAAYITYHSDKIPVGNFGAYGPDGLLEESGHVWGKGDGTVSDEDMLKYLKDSVDKTLKEFGWRLT